MGTSTSSGGAPSGVSFDPPWINGIALQIDPEVSVMAVPDAPSERARFKEARIHLSKYLRSGGEPRLKASVGHYVKHGLGGARRAASRLQIPVAASVAIWSSLQRLMERDDKDAQEWIDRILSADDKIEALEEELAKQVVPEGGSVDEESCRRSIAYAISELQREYPNVEVEQLHEDGIFFIIELFLAREIFNRYLFDIGQRLEQMKIADMPRCEKEIMRYIRSTLSVKMKTLRKKGAHRTKKEMLELMSNVLRETLEVFEEAAE